MTVLFGLAAAIVYGVGDFSGALASRWRGSAVAVLAYTYPVGAALMLVCAPFFGGSLTGRAWVYGALGGCAGVLGVAVLYSLMSIGPMNVISPVSAVFSALVPVAFGVLIGERPSVLAWAGMTLGLLAVVLVSRTREDHPHGRIAGRVLVGAAVSGIGFGAYFICLGHAGPSTGMWTLVVARCAGLLVVTAWALSAGVLRPALRGRVLTAALGAGICDSSANLLFVLATQHGLLALASVLTALYPAFTVLLAVTLLHEHTSRTQQVGLALAAASVVLVTV